MGSYRSRLEIIADVLGVVGGGARKTQIMYQANLSYKLLVKYLNYVLEAGLLSEGNDNTYVLTQKGRDFLDQFEDYSERRKELERRFSKIRDEKMRLKNRFLNSGMIYADLKNCLRKQRNRKEKKGE